MLPVLTFDRELIWIQRERLSSSKFSLDRLTNAFSVLARKFRDVVCGSGKSCIILEFSESTLLNNYRKTNHLMTQDAREGRNRKLGSLLTILFNNSPPDSWSLLN